MASVRAATRVSIAWKGAEPIEDTATLVLTIKGWSLDLRVFVTGSNAGEIDWSTVARVVEVEGSTSDRPILRWDHIIDSRPPTDMDDQGAFTSLPNGDVQERGTMFNPKTSEYEAYVETWRRFPLQASSPYCVLERDDGRAFIGRVGDRALGLAKLKETFTAWWDELSVGQWHRKHDFWGQNLPSLPISLPNGWTEGAQIILDGQRWLVRAAGTT